MGPNPSTWLNLIDPANKKYYLPQLSSSLMVEMEGRKQRFLQEHQTSNCKPFENNLIG